jgi:Winged helix DNA-binding domain
MPLCRENCEWFVQRALQGPFDAAPMAREDYPWLARRYLAGHGPAAPSDLAAWSGLPLRDARTGLSAVAGELFEAGGDLVDVPRPIACRPASRRACCSPPSIPTCSATATGASRCPPYTLAASIRAAASCAPRRRTTDARSAPGPPGRRGGRVTLEMNPFVPFSRRVATALRSEAAGVARFEALALA